MNQFHEKCENIKLSADRKSGKRTGRWSGFIVFSDKVLENGTVFSWKLTGIPEWVEKRYGYLPVWLGVTSRDPASHSDPLDPPDRSSILTGSCLVHWNGSLYKDGRSVGRGGVRLAPRETTELGVRWVDGVVWVYQDGVDKGVVVTGLRGPVWAIVYPRWYDRITVISKEMRTIALEQMPAPVTYKMDSRPRGYAVIVNISRVIGQDERPGSEHDVSRLTKLFSKLHFKVKTLENFSAQDIHNELRGISKRPDFKSQDAFVLVMMSHGGPGYILGADGDKLDLEKTFSLFSNLGCPELTKKPKLIFIQSCNGDKEDNGIQADDTTESPKVAELPSIPDMLIAKASVKGYKNWRNPDKGSYFIQCLVDEFEEHAAVLDVGRIMTRVVRNVQGKAACMTQCPVIKTTLTRDLYLHP